MSPPARHEGADSCTCPTLVHRDSVSTGTPAPHAPGTSPGEAPEPHSQQEEGRPDALRPPPRGEEGRQEGVGHAPPPPAEAQAGPGGSWTGTRLPPGAGGLRVPPEPVLLGTQQASGPWAWTTAGCREGPAPADHQGGGPSPPGPRPDPQIRAGSSARRTRGVTDSPRPPASPRAHGAGRPGPGTGPRALPTRASRPRHPEEQSLSLIHI